MLQNVPVVPYRESLTTGFQVSATHSAAAARTGDESDADAAATEQTAGLLLPPPVVLALTPRLSPQVISKDFTVFVVKVAKRHQLGYAQRIRPGPDSARDRGGGG